MKAILKPFTEKIGALTELVQSMDDNLQEQTKQLKSINEKLNEALDQLYEKGIFKPKENSH